MGKRSILACIQNEPLWHIQTWAPLLAPPPWWWRVCFRNPLLAFIHIFSQPLAVVWQQGPVTFLPCQSCCAITSWAVDLLPESLCRPAKLMEKGPVLENTLSSAGKASLETPATLQGLDKPRGRPAWLMLRAGLCVECVAEFMHVMNVCVVPERGCELGREIKYVSNSSFCVWALFPLATVKTCILFFFFYFESPFSMSSSHAEQENCVWVDTCSQCGSPYSTASRAGTAMSSCGHDLMILPQEWWQEWRRCRWLNDDSLTGQGQWNHLAPQLEWWAADLSHKPLCLALWPKGIFTVHVGPSTHFPSSLPLIMSHLKWVEGLLFFHLNHWSWQNPWLRHRIQWQRKLWHTHAQYQSDVVVFFRF